MSYTAEKLLSLAIAFEEVTSDSLQKSAKKKEDKTSKNKKPEFWKKNKDLNSAKDKKSDSKTDSKSNRSTEKSKDKKINKKTTKKSFVVFDKFIAKYGQGKPAVATNANGDEIDEDGNIVNPRQYPSSPQKPADPNNQWAQNAINNALSNGGKSVQPKELNYSPNPNMNPPGQPNQSVAPSQPKTAPTSTPKSNVSPQTKQVQMALNKLNLRGADGKPLAEDGVLGKNTSFAIQSYKTEYNMPQATDAMAIYNILNTKPEDHKGRYATPPAGDISRDNPY